MVCHTSGVNLAQALADLAAGRDWLDRPAYLVGDRTLTHGQVHDGAARAAGLLAAQGVGRGDRVVIATGDRVEFLWAFLGAVRLGAIAVPVDPELALAEHAYVLADTAPGVVVAEARLAERFERVAQVIGADDLADLLTDSPWAPAADVGRADAAYGQYTSGTTGHPKLALHVHGDAFVYHQAAGGALGIGPDDVCLSVSRLHTANGLGNALFLPLAAGACAVLVAGRLHQAPDPTEVAEAAGRTQPTLLFAAPTAWARLVDAVPGRPSRRLRAAISSGETLTPALAERIRQWAGCPVLDGLGSTEVGHVYCSNTAQAWRDGTVGRPLAPFEVREADTAGNDLPPGTQGLLWVRGPSVLLEYWNKPEATASALVDGWLRTGDLGSIDPDGFVRHGGRADDIEIVRGTSVSAVEVERVLADHIGVAEVAVAGVRDDRGASHLEAFVVPTDPAMAGDALAASVIALAAERLAPFKVPERVIFVSELPRTPTGRLRRFVLRLGGYGAEALIGSGTGTRPA